MGIDDDPLAVDARVVRTLAASPSSARPHPRGSPSAHARVVTPGQENACDARGPRCPRIRVEGPQFRPLAAGRLFASVAEWMWYTVATVYAFTLAGVGAVGAIGVAAVFPRCIAVARRWAMSSTGSPRTRPGSDARAALRLALTAAAVSAAFFPSVTVLVAVAVAEGVASLFVRPTPGRAARYPSPEDLVRAYAGLSFADNVSVLVGPVSGGLILAGTTPAIAFPIAAAFALLSSSRRLE